MPHEVADSRQSAIADGPKRFVGQLPLRSIEFQSPVPPMADDLRGRRYRRQRIVVARLLSQPAGSNRRSSRLHHLSRTRITTE